MNKNDTLQKIHAIFERGLIVDVLPDKESFIKALLDRQLTFYIGFDPTNAALHLGHAQNFMVLEEFRQLGHKVVVLFGDFTACIGDPGDQKTARRQLTRDTTTRNAMNWKEQVRNLMDFDAAVNPPRIVFNSAWLDKLSLEKLVGLAAQTTVQRMLERDMFQKRMAENKPVHLHEFLYPLFQGFDSVALQADVELCGTDQTFNALLGRQLVRNELNKEKFCVLFQLMNHPLTGEPVMSKSKGTGVFLDAGPRDMFGGIMALPDEMIDRILLWNTRIPLADIRALDIARHPRDAKMFAATEVVSLFHGRGNAEEARRHFIDTFSKRDFPENAPIVSVGQDRITLFEMLKRCLPEKSGGDIRRLVAQKAVSVDGKKCIDEKQLFDVSAPVRVKVGKLGFFQVAA